MSLIEWLRGRLSSEQAVEPIASDPLLEEAIAQWEVLHQQHPDGPVPPPPRSGPDPITPRPID